MSNLSDAFDRWIRGSFMEINTELENLYFAQAGPVGRFAMRRKPEVATAR